MKSNRSFKMLPASSPQANLSFLTAHSRVWIMGVINATPDSFYSGSRFVEPAVAADHAERLLAEGADVLDLGGESTRPGANDISAAEELQRILPVLDTLVARFPSTPISIDTRKAEVARHALAHGASWVNDISALRHDPEMALVIAESHAPVVLMHMQGTPQTMQKNPHYDHLIDDVRAFFEERLNAAERAGIARDKIILDPGFGFGKTVEHQMALLRHLRTFTEWGLPLLVGVSRKSFIGKLENAGEPIPVENRLEGSLAAGLWAVMQGARGLRVHDVAATRRALRIWERLSDSQPTVS